MHKFDIGQFDEFSFKLGKNAYLYSECKILFERTSFNRTTIDLVVETVDGKFAALCITADAPEYAVNGITKGYYKIDELTKKQVDELT